MIYINGIANSFAESAYTTAELSYFLGGEMVPLVYSWPAGKGGALAGYGYDRESSEFTVFHLKTLLKVLGAMPELKGLHIVAHSRGTDVITAALRELVIEYAARGDDVAGRLKIKNLVLAAVHMVEYVGGASGSLGHSYFRTNPAVASDLVLTVRYDRDPGASNARPLAHRGGVFWQVDDSYLGPVDHSNSGAREWSTRPGTAVIQA